MNKSTRLSSALLLIGLLTYSNAFAQRRQGQTARVSKPLHEVNQVEQPAANHVIAIVGATLIDGRGGPAIPDAVVIIRGEQIAAVGKRSSMSIPPGAVVWDAKGLTLLPGLIDAHFHIDGDDPLPALYLSHGITSLRDPGQWIEAYDAARKLSAPVPRLFLCGPHLDSAPPAYPADSFMVRDAEKYRQAVLADNNARREGRYQVWNSINLETPRARALSKLIVDHGIFVSPTLAVFERQTGDKDTTEMHVHAFKQMEAFVRLVHGAGAKVVVGSHSDVPHAKRGWAYQRELELLVESGLTPMQAIVAGTLENARFFRAADRLGSIEPGKLADLVLVEGDPQRNISDMRRLKRVMLNGVWVNSVGALEK